MKFNYQKVDILQFPNYFKQFLISTKPSVICNGFKSFNYNFLINVTVQN